jgi:hypothetical protein
MWIIFPILFLLLFFGAGPAVAVYGVVIVIRRKVRLTSTRMLQGEQAVAAGLFVIFGGIAFFVFQVNWFIANYPRGW